MQTQEQELALGRLASRQNGLFVVSDAQRCGLGAQAIRRRVQRGLLIEPQPGVYASPTRPASAEFASRAALLAAGPAAVLSHTSAAAVWALRATPPPRPWITLPFGYRLPAVQGVEVVRSRYLDGFRRRYQGWPLTSPARTWVDCGRVLDERSLEACLASGMQRGLITHPELAAVLALAHHRAGTGLARRVLARFQPEWESILSAELGRLAEAAGIRLVAGHRLTLADGRIVILDFADVGRRLAVEADGWAFHGSLAQQQRDRERDRNLLLLGWSTVRFTSTDITGHPRQVVDDLRSLLSSGVA